MPVVAVRDFLKTLASSHLLDGAERQQARQWSESLADDAAESLAQQLVREKLLTRWQAGMLLSGRNAFFLGKYKLLRELGRGGMGAVFQAQQMPFGRIVAIKVMSPKLVQNPDAVARFHREIQAAAALNHPHVVAALDADQAQQTHFLVMEFVEGESLDELLQRETKLPIGLACEFLRQAAEGLQHAHERGMVHRDIKPANLLLARTSEETPLVKILDMGLARFTSEVRADGELTQTGQVMGTPDYIAPEQAQNTKNADIRSDIFSLGCTLFRMLSGRLPFSGANVMEKLMARALSDAPPLRKFCPEVSADLEAVVARMLARDPSRRYQSPGEVAAALAPFVVWDHRPVPATVPPSMGAEAPLFSGDAAAVAATVDPALNQLLQDLANEAAADDDGIDAASHRTAVEAGRPAETLTTNARLSTARAGSSGPKPRFPRQHEQRPSQRTALLGGLAIAAAVVVAVAGWQWQRVGATHLLLDWPDDERAKAMLEVDGTRLTVPAKGEISIPSGKPGQRRARLVRPGYEPIDQTWEFARGQTRTFRPEWKPTARTARQQTLAELTRDAETMLARFGGTWPQMPPDEVGKLLERYRQARPKFLQTPELAAFTALGPSLPASADRLSADDIPEQERRLAEQVCGEKIPAGVVALWGDGRFKFLGHQGIDSLAIHPGGKFAAIGSGSSVVSLWDLQTGLLAGPVFNSATATWKLAFSEDGQHLFVPSVKIELRSVPGMQLESKIPIPADDKTVRGLAVVPKRQLLAFIAGGRDVWLWDLQAQQPKAPLSLPESEQLATSLAVSRDGRWLAAGGNDGAVRLWDLESGTSRDLPPHSSSVLALAFSPDHRILAGGYGHFVRLSDVSKGETIREIHGFRHGVHSLSWNAKGTLLSTNTGSQAITLWDPTDGTRVQSVECRGPAGNTIAQFTPDGRLVTATVSGELQVWDVTRPQELPPTGPAVVCAAMDPLGEWVALGTTAGLIELRDLGSGEIRRTLTCGTVPTSLAVSFDRRRLMAACRHEEPSLRLFDLSGSDDPRFLDEVPNATAAAFTPDGRTVIAGNHQSVAAWDVADRKLKFKHNLNDRGPRTHWGHLQISADGTRVLLGGGMANVGAFCVLNLPDGEIIGHEKTMPVRAVAISPDSKHGILGSGTAAYLIDMKSGKKSEQAFLTPVHGRGFTSMASAPQGNQFVGSSLDGKLYFMPVRTLAIRQEINLGSFATTAIQVLYTPDGRHLVLVMDNGTVWVLRPDE